MQTLAKLKDRKVIQWAAGYFAVAWGALEVLSFLADQFSWPGFIVRSATVILGAGFFVTLVLAWHHGDKGHQRVTANEAVLLAALIVGAGALTVFVNRPQPESAVLSVPAAGQLTRLTVNLPRDQRLAIRGAGSYPLAVSPDGTQVAYVAITDAGIQLVVRPLDSFEATVLPDTEDAMHPFFSPDGEWLGFFTRDALKKVPLDGGRPVRIAATDGLGRGGSWGAGNRILYGLESGGLWIVAAAGGEPRRIELQSSEQVDTEGFLGWPSLLPDGEHAVATNAQQGFVFSIDTGEIVHVTPSSNQIRYAASGHLLYTNRGGRVLAVAFDVDALEARGEPFAVLDSVFRAPGRGAVLFDVSQTGTLVLVGGGFGRSLMLADRYGRTRPLTEDKRGFRFPRFSPDGSRVVVTVDPRPSSLWIYDSVRGVGEKVTADDCHCITPVWRPNPRRIVHYCNNRLCGFDPDNIDTSDTRASMLTEQIPGFFPFSADSTGNLIVGSYRTDDRLTDVYAVTLDEQATLTPVVSTNAHDYMPDISPDDRWIAYVSDETGRSEIYVQPLSGPGRRVRVSADGGTDPVWSRDGAELFYRDGETILSAQVTGPPLAFSEPGPLFTATDLDTTQTRNWDVSSNGQFVLVHSDPTTTREFQVVLNWFQALSE